MQCLLKAPLECLTIQSSYCYEDVSLFVGAYDPGVLPNFAAIYSFMLLEDAKDGAAPSGSFSTAARPN